jgi:hypothetical protein
MEPLAAKALEIALSNLGVKEDPPGSNRGHAVDIFLRSVGLDPERGAYPWCAAFLCYCIQQAREAIPVPLQFKRSGRCERLVELNQALLLPRAEAGAVFVHLKPNGDGHTGFVTAVREDGSIETCEGNSDSAGSRTGGSVVRQHRAADYVNAYLRIA